MHIRKDAEKQQQGNDFVCVFIHFRRMLIYEKGDQQESINTYRIKFKFCSRSQTYGVRIPLVFWIWFRQSTDVVISAHALKSAYQYWIHQYIVFHDKTHLGIRHTTKDSSWRPANRPMRRCIAAIDAAVAECL